MISSLPATAQEMSNGAANFYRSDKVTVQKVTFKNQYRVRRPRGIFSSPTP